MSSVAYVERAQRMARFVEDDEFRVVGDRDKARRSIARRYGIAVHALKALRYQPPKQVAADIYAALCEAVEDAAQRRIRMLEHEIAEARAGHLGVRADNIRAAEAALKTAVALLNGSGE